MEDKGRLMPLFLVKPGSMKRRDIIRAQRQSGICIVECSEPEAARYQELPISYNIDDQARAALSLMRTVISSPTPDFKRGDLTKWFVDELLSWNQPKRVMPVAPAMSKKV